ncbi:MAG TPA: TraM recognition domain-containing protein, partial [Candidatus Nitrosocosmicus sp.]|nr:TraM recognition domain-containing protein [Candidatus Nitrosocosmicus sp.]
NDNVLAYLDHIHLPSYIKPLGLSFKLLFSVFKGIVNNVQWAVSELTNPTVRSIYSNQQYQYQQLHIQQDIKPLRTLTRFEQETIQSIEEKIDQPLFETSIRLLVKVDDKQNEHERVNGFISSLGNYNVSGYQSIVKAKLLPDFIYGKVRALSFKKRLLSLFTNSGSSLLSASEIADLYHFPFKGVTQTENIVKVYAKELPAPLSLKQGKKLDVVFGKNTYGGVTTDIGLTEEQRQTHTYIIGRTGSGKTTLMFSMAKRDIEEGRGMGFVDPHGDVSEELINSIPLERKADLIYLNPFDIKHPVGINVLELTEGLDDDELELEKEVVCEGVVSLFKKVFSKEENANAHRIEHILRNTIYTAFYVKDRTLFTINTLLSDDTFRKDVISKIDDEDLLNFWKSEFGKAGDFQVVKMTQGVTAKVGRFLRSPTARRMLEQTKSTINFDDILNGKILICNLSQGKLGEDTTKLIGTTILTKLQQAALKRALVEKSNRKPFYLYIDEFQNFATYSFIKIVSEGRKYGLHLIMGEQSTSQQQDRSIVNQLLANVTTVIVFRTGNYLDEDLMLTQFAPYLQKGDIPNLSRYHFYIKNSALDSEEPFSGETIYTPIQKDINKIQTLIQVSRKNWAIVYVKKAKKLIELNEPKTNENSSQSKSGPPKLRRKK